MAVEIRDALERELPFQLSGNIANPEDLPLTALSKPRSVAGSAGFSSGDRRSAGSDE
jgi:hypothetical protein